MATGDLNLKEIPQNLRTQLALAVKSIEWSYAIFWSISSGQPGVLQWSEGYYNGDIKTRKTVQEAEVNLDQLGLQRTDQLRELFESLLLGETKPQAIRPTAALSPEDLTDSEWYFLICMSFVFNADQGLPGRTIASNRTIWLSNAHRADTKVFPRALIAKSASVKTVVCFPHLGGVVEFGTTELVQEDPNLIRRITSFLESHVTVSKITNHVFNASAKNNDLTRERLGHAHMPKEDLDHLVDDPYVEICSPNNYSDDLTDDEPRGESNLEGVDGDASQIQSWPVMNDAVSNCVNNSVNSSDCTSKAHEERETIIPLSDGKKETKGFMHDNQECNKQKTSDVQGNDSHYHSVLSSLLKSSHQLLLGPYIGNRSRGSSFVCWRKNGSPGARVPQRGTPQKLLKKVLFEVARMHESSRVESGKQDANSKRQVDEIDSNHVLSERKRREKINERFVILESLVPSGGKADKVSILDHAIEYLRGLERKVEELESYKEAMEQASTTRTKSSDSNERTSYYRGKDNPKNPATNKRKTCDKDRIEAQNSKARLRDSPTDSISICVSQKDVLIEIRCSWKEHVLLEVMERLSKLRLETSTVQSSTTEGTLSITVNAKSKGVKSPSAEVIKQALQKVMRKR